MSSNERVGFIVLSGEIIEVPNIARNPQDEFEVADAVMIKYEDEAIATWHTHPSTTWDLSAEDYTAFLMWPDLIHFIVSPQGVRGYVVVNEAVINDACHNHPAWQFAEGLAARL